jgi:acetolactate synthase-1/2/3 large subunit
MMVVAELETVARLRLPLVIVVFDDQALSLIEVNRSSAASRASMRYAGPDFPALARAFGIRAWIAEDEESFRNALVAAQATAAPALIDARIDPSGYRRTLEIVRGAPAR